MAGGNYFNFILHYIKLKILLTICIKFALASISSELIFLGEPNSNLNSEDKNMKYPITQRIENKFTPELAEYFLNFAGFGYCEVKEMDNKTCCEDLIEGDGWEVIAKQSINFDDYNYAILKNDNSNKIVITFPGTRGDFQFTKEIFYSNGVPLDGDNKEKVMNYFKQIWVLIKGTIGDEMKKVFEEHPDYQFIFTGHSLGAAIATIAALDSVKYENLKKTESSPVLITYGQPRTGNDYFANEVMNYVPIIFRIVRQGDFVSTIPLCVFDTQSKKCINILPDSKFSKELSLTNEQIEAEEKNYYSWHLGNLILYTDDMKSYIECSSEFGDNDPNENCKIIFSYNIYHHLIYFGKFISRMCGRR